MVHIVRIQPRHRHQIFKEGKIWVREKNYPLLEPEDLLQLCTMKGKIFTVVRVTKVTRVRDLEPVGRGNTRDTIYLSLSFVSGVNR